MRRSALMRYVVRAGTACGLEIAMLFVMSVCAFWSAPPVPFRITYFGN